MVWKTMAYAYARKLPSFEDINDCRLVLQALQPAWCIICSAIDKSGVSTGSHK